MGGNPSPGSLWRCFASPRRSDLSQRERWPNTHASTLSTTSLKLPVQPCRKDRDRSAVGVVSRVGDQLVVGGEGKVLVDGVGVIGFENLFGAVVDAAVADQETVAAGCEKVAVRAGEAVDRAADADRIARTAPIASLDRDAARQAAVDIGERQDFITSVVPAQAAEDADVLGDLLFTIDVETVFEPFLPQARHHVVEVENGIRGADRQRLAIIAGIAAVGEDAEPQFAGLVENIVALF